MINNAAMLGLLSMVITTKAVSAINSATEESNITHTERDDTVESALKRISHKIKQRGDLSYISVAQQLELLAELSKFELGRFLLQRGGLNGYWTQYIITHPKRGRLTGLNSENKPFTPLESFLLDKAPVCLATQQRFEIFKQETQRRLCKGISLASIPCGLMLNLLELDYSKITEFEIFGVDIDPESLSQSLQMAQNCGLEDHCHFIQRGAWTLNYQEQFDIITSNGLSIYEPDDKKIVELYKQFFIALKPNGCVITSFLTPKSEWKSDAISAEDALLQKILLGDIIECKWQQALRSEHLVRSQLLEAGFSEVEVIYDQAHVFPTIVAKKS